MMNLLYLNKFLPVLVIFLGISCGSEQPPAADPKATATADNIIRLTEEQLANSSIQSAKPEKQTISEVLRLSGKVDVPPQNIISISVPLSGYLRETSLLSGSFIRKGEVLAVVEDQQYIQIQEDYLTTQAQLRFLESEFRRQKELNEVKASSDKVFEQSRANYQTQLVMLKSLEQKLKLIGVDPAKVDAANISKIIRIYSPVSGYVSKVNVNIGRYVMPGEVMFELIDPEDIHLKLTVFERDVNKLTIGQKLYAYTNNAPEDKYLCDIILISKNLNVNNATEVHCHFDKYDPKLIPGMFMNAEIELSTHEAVTLPEEAIVRYGNKNYGFIRKSTLEFEMVELKTGNSENGRVELLEGEMHQPHEFVVKDAYVLLMVLKNTAED